MRKTGKGSFGLKAAGVIVGSIRPSVVKRAASLGADLLEVRVDTFKRTDTEGAVNSLKKLKGLTRLPVILTIRSASEGGSFITEKQRAGLFEALIPYSDYVDIELSSSRIIGNVVDSAKRKGKKVIVSCHDFRKTPEEKKLNNIIRMARARGADIVKIASLVKHPSDFRRLAGLLLLNEGLIVIGMGGLGAASRVFFPMLGSCLTYGSITEATAPGQMSLKEIKKEFRRYGF